MGVDMALDTRKNPPAQSTETARWQVGLIKPSEL